MAITDRPSKGIAGDLFDFDILPNISDPTRGASTAPIPKKPVLTPKEYQTQFVDFYSQTLGKTGIDVDDDDDDDDDDDKTDDKDVNIQAAPISGDDETFVSYSTIGSDKFTEPDVEIINLQNVVATDYKDLLDKDNVKDLTNFDSFGITFSKPSTSTFKKAGTTIGLAKVLSPTMSLMGADLVGSMFGDERKEIDGKTGFRPSGGLGLAYDMNMSNQAANINASKQAAQANKIESERARLEGRTPNLKGEGFYARIDGQLVSRKPGKTYYDGVYNYTPEQLKSMEALRKGFNPSGYNLIKETGSESIINTSTTRGYTERGSFVSINGTAATGLQRDLDNLVTASNQKYGVTFTEAQVRDALRAARNAHSIFSRTTKKGSGLSDFLSKTANQIKAKADADRRAKIARDIAEKQRKAAEERKRQQEEQARRNQEAATRDTSQGSISYGDDSDVGSNEGVGQGGDPYGGLEFSSGGRIGMQEGDVASNQVTVKEPGFISPDANATKQQEIADDKPMDAKEGDFIINAPAAEEAGKQDIQRMINTAITNLQEKGVDVRFGNPKINIADKVKLLVSRNEVYIPAIIAKEIGYDRLKKINNRGKREVQRRQEESQQDEKPQARGFIQKKKGDVVATADYSEGGIDATSGMLLRLTGHLKNIEQGLGEGFKYGKKSKAGDTLRHILTSGYISEDGFFNKFMSDLFDGREISENMSEENRVDLNNNKFGRLLRQKYPDRMEFTKQARQVVKDLLKGKKTEIDGVSPMLSVKAEQHL